MAKKIKCEVFTKFDGSEIGEVEGYDDGEFFVHKSIHSNDYWAVTDKESKKALLSSLSFLSAARFIAKDKSLPELCKIAKNKSLSSRSGIIKYVSPWLRTFRTEKNNFISFEDYLKEAEEKRPVKKKKFKKFIS